VARAKRTDRADARRRYRQIQTGDVEGAEPVDDEGPVATQGPRPRSAAPERPSITAAFRNAYHRANVREDVAALPWLLRSRAFFVAVGLVLVGSAAYAVAPTEFIPGLLFQSLVYPPAMAPIFVVGFFAKRASYLLGLIVAIIDVAAFALVVYSLPAGDATTTPAEQAQLRQQIVFSALSVGPLSGIFFAAAAAWYRRFLNLSNARAQQRRPPASRAGRATRS
jgi:hypothetical protein